MGMTNEQIEALLGKSRTKGGYLTKMNEFLASGQQGINVSEEWPAEFPAEGDNKKKAATVKQGFENAKNNKQVAEGADKVKVISNEDQVYLINLGLGSGNGAEATADETETALA